MTSNDRRMLVWFIKQAELDWTQTVHYLTRYAEEKQPYQLEAAHSFVVSYLADKEQIEVWR